MVPRAVWLNLHRCYFATFADGETLILDINYSTNEYTQDVVSFNVRSGGRFSFEVPIPSKGALKTVAGDESGHHAWSTSSDVRRMVGRYIVAFAAIIRLMYPQLQQVNYHNSAVIDDMDATDAVDEEELRKVAEDALYRVRYYERLGFKFDVPYDSQLEDAIVDLTHSPILEDLNDPSFSGELLSMAETTIPQTYPDECTLVRLHREVCS